MPTTVVFAETLRNRTVVSSALDRLVDRLNANFGDLDPIVSVNHVEWFGKRAGFIMVNTLIVRDGVRIPGAAMLRGDGVGILVVLKTPEQEYTVLVTQDRLAVGQAGYAEIPAGSLDKPGLDFLDIAALEVQEEVDPSLTATNGAFTMLGQFHPSPGGLDEIVALVSYTHECTEDYVASLQGSITGADEGEVIRLRVIALDELPENTSDMKSVLAYHLYRKQN